MGKITKYKKYLLIIGFIAIVIIIGYFIYSLFFKSLLAPGDETPGATITISGGLPSAQTGQGQIVDTTGSAGLPSETGAIVAQPISQVAQGGLTTIKALTSLPTLEPTIDSSGSSVNYYNQSDGKFYKIDKNGQAVLLSDKIFHEVKNVVWSPTDDEAIIEYPDGSNILYNFTTEEQATLPAHWKDFAFSTTGSQIVMKSMGLNQDNRWLAVANKDGSNTQVIESLGDKDDTVYPSWQPNNQTIAMYTEGVDFDTQEVYFVGLNNENFKSTVIEGRGFQYLWSPQGDRLLYSVYSSANDLKPLLWIVNAEGNSIGSNRKNLNIETWAEKCVFADNINIYCAVPKELEPGAGLFPEMANNTTDSLYEINTQTGLKKLIAVPDGNYSMTNLIISDNGYYLYFTNQTTKNLYQIKIK